MRWCRKEKRWRPNSVWRKPIPRPAWLTRVAVLPADGDAGAGDRRRCARSWPIMRRTACRRNWWRRPSAGKSPTRSSGATPFPGLAECVVGRAGHGGAQLARRRCGRHATRHAGRREPRRQRNIWWIRNSITAQLKPMPSGEPVAGQGFGGAEQLTAAPTKPVELPSWAASRTARAENAAGSAGARGHDFAERAAADRENGENQPDDHGARQRPQRSRTGNAARARTASATCWTICFPTARRTWTGWRFKKRWTISRPRNPRDFDFQLQVLKQDFSRGVQLLADNELNPALPDEAFDVIKPQTAQFVAGQNEESRIPRGPRAGDGACFRPAIRRCGRRRRRRFPR